jgi:hypothetical protein
MLSRTAGPANDTAVWVAVGGGGSVAVGGTGVAATVVAVAVAAARVAVGCCGTGLDWPAEITVEVGEGIPAAVPGSGKVAVGITFGLVLNTAVRVRSGVAKEKGVGELARGILQARIPRIRTRMGRISLFRESFIRTPRGGLAFRMDILAII